MVTRGSWGWLPLAAVLATASCDKPPAPRRAQPAPLPGPPAAAVLAAEDARLRDAALRAALAAAKSHDPARRARAMYDLAGCGAEPNAVLPVLLAALDDKARNVRACAARALGLLRPEEPQAAAKLAAMLRDGDEWVRDAAAEALLNIATETSLLPLAERLLGRRADEGEPNAPPLPAADDGRQPAGQVVAGLAASLRTGSRRERFAALLGLGRQGAMAQPDLPLIASFLGDRDWTMRLAAVKAVAGVAARPAALPHLRRALEDDNALVRAAAWRELARLGLPGEAVAGRLAELSDEEIAARLPKLPGAADVLRLPEPMSDTDAGRLGCGLRALVLGEPSRPKDANEVAGYLRHDDEAIRARAVEAMGQFGAAARPFAAAIEQRLADTSTIVRAQAALALARLGVTAKVKPAEVAKLLADDDWDVREAAARALGELGPAAAAAAGKLARGLADRNSFVRTACARALAKVGAAKDALPQLVHLLVDVPRVRTAALEALAAAGPAARAELAAVNRLFRADSEGDVRAAAARALGRMGPPAEAVGALADALRDPNGQVRAAALEAIGGIGPANADAAEALARRMDPFSTDASVVVAALERIGPAGIPHMRPLLKGGGVETRCQAALALGCMGPQAAALLAEALRDPTDEVKIAAAGALGRLGPPAGGAVAELIALTADTNGTLRHEAARAVVRVGAPAVGPLTAALAARKGYSRWHVISALGEIGPSARAALPALAALLDANDDGVVRGRAATAMGRIGPPERVVPALIKAVGDGDSYVRWRAAEALGKLGPAAAGAKDALARAAGDEDKDVRSAAAAAMKNVQR